MSSAPQVQRPTRQAEMSAQSRDRIMDAAASLFAEQGYSKTSLKGIEERAGISRGSILHHFGSKDRLLLAVVERNFHAWIAGNLDQLAADPERTWAETLTHSHLAFLTDNPEANRRFYILAFEALSGNDDLAKRYVQLQDEMLAVSRESIQARVAAGEIRDDIDVGSLARFTHALYLGLGLQSLFSDTVELPALYADVLTALNSALEPSSD